MASHITIRDLTAADIRVGFQAALSDFKAAPLSALFVASVFVIAGWLMTWITWISGTTFWLVLAVLGFPLVGALAAVGFYEISRMVGSDMPVSIQIVWQRAWGSLQGQMPWLAAIIVIVFLFWFFIGHMIFALFLGLAPMRNVMSSLDVFLSPAGLQMLAFGSLVGAGFAILVFSISVLAFPMLIDRDVDFMTALTTSMGAVIRQPLIYIGWGALIGCVTLLSMVPWFLGLFFTMPVFGFMTWHIYQRVSAGETPAP